MSYIYIIKEREFIKTKENIYKIGKSRQENCRRINSYPKGSMLYFIIAVNDCDVIEQKIIKSFKKKFTHKTDIGNEYFNGDIKIMISTMFRMCNKDLYSSNDIVCKEDKNIIGPFKICNKYVNTNKQKNRRWYEIYGKDLIGKYYDGTFIMKYDKEIINVNDKEDKDDEWDKYGDSDENEDEWEITGYENYEMFNSNYMFNSLQKFINLFDITNYSNFYIDTSKIFIKYNKIINQDEMFKFFKKDNKYYDSYKNVYNMASTIYSEYKKDVMCLFRGFFTCAGCVKHCSISSLLIDKNTIYNGFGYIAHKYDNIVHMVILLPSDKIKNNGIKVYLCVVDNNLEFNKQIHEEYCIKTK